MLLQALLISRKWLRHHTSLRACLVHTATQPLSGRSFDDLGVPSSLQTALASQGITCPAGIQAAAIPEVLSGKNCGIQSYTGSGKTLSYLLPAIMRAQQEPSHPQWPRVLIVAPGHELCMQILRQARPLLPPSERDLVQQLIGGANPKRQSEALRKHRPLIVVGTPGRLLDMMGDKGSLKVWQCPFLVLDEVDHLLESFKTEVDQICAHVGSRAPNPRQTVVVSASLTSHVMDRISGWCTGGALISPQHVDRSVAQMQSPSSGTGGSSVDPGALEADTTESGVALDQKQKLKEAIPLDPKLPPNLQHYYVVAPIDHQIDHLRRCIHALKMQRALVFVNFLRHVMDTKYKLEARNMEVTVLHGDLSKMERTNISEAFRRGVFRALVTTDISARGLDIPGCDAVVNIGVPPDDVKYAHRAGRTGRMGAPGSVVTLIGRHEIPVLQRYGRRLGIQIKPASIVRGSFLGEGAGDLESTTEIGLQDQGPAALQVDEEGQGGPQTSLIPPGWDQEEQASRSGKQQQHLLMEDPLVGWSADALGQIDRDRSGGQHWHLSHHSSRELSQVNVEKYGRQYDRRGIPAGNGKVAQVHEDGHRGSQHSRPGGAWKSGNIDGRLIQEPRSGHRQPGRGTARGSQKEKGYQEDTEQGYRSRSYPLRLPAVEGKEGGDGTASAGESFTYIAQKSRGDRRGYTYLELQEGGPPRPEE